MKINTQRMTSKELLRDMSCLDFCIECLLAADMYGPLDCTPDDESLHHIFSLYLHMACALCLGTWDLSSLGVDNYRILPRDKSNMGSPHYIFTLRYDTKSI